MPGPNPFLEKERPPDGKDLAAALGGTAILWTAIREGLEAGCGPLQEEWKYYGAKAGWTMKLLLGKRNLFFLSPGTGSFMVSFVLGDKAVATLVKSDLPADLIEEARGARRYAEGRGLRLEVRSGREVDIVLKLTAIKLAG